MTTQLGQVRTRWAAAITTVAIALLTAAAVLLVGRQLAELENEREVRAAAADAVAPVSDAIRTALDDAALGKIPAAKQFAVAEAESAGISTASATTARDSGLPVLDDTGEGSVVVASYDTEEVPASVDERRAHVSGLSVVPLAVGPVLTDLQPAQGGISIDGPDRTVLSVPDAAPADATAYQVEMAPGRARLDSATTATPLAPDWSLTVWAPPAGIPLAAWASSVGILLLAAALAAWLVRRADRLRRSRNELVRLQEGSARVAALATVAQHSLDLANVLPAIATELSATLGLRGLSLATPTVGGERPYFTWGEAPDESSAPRALPSELAPGESLTLMLSRGGRSVAKVGVLAGRPLDTHDMDTLGAAADILASALANAEAFAQQRELLLRMRSLDELKTVFLATASHELRTPVGAISGFARILSTSWDSLPPEQAQLYAEKVDSNAQRLSALVEDLLDFSRLERGIGNAAADSVLDLGDTVTGILDEQPDLAGDHELQHKTTRGLHVSGSVQAVERVISNLVGNAAKYSPVGTTIRVTVSENRGRAELAVSDEGPGVPPAEREQIFSRFFRGGGEAVVSTRGAGLGLAIVSEFAASMGGRVSVTAADTGGALFVVSYPLAGPPEATEGVPHVDP